MADSSAVLADLVSAAVTAAIRGKAARRTVAAVGGAAISAAAATLHCDQRATTNVASKEEPKEKEAEEGAPVAKKKARRRRRGKKSTREQGPSLEVWPATKVEAEPSACGSLAMDIDDVELSASAPTAPESSGQQNPPDQGRSDARPPKKEGNTAFQQAYSAALRAVVHACKGPAIDHEAFREAVNAMRTEALDTQSTLLRYKAAAARNVLAGEAFSRSSASSSRPSELTRSRVG